MALSPDWQAKIRTGRMTQAAMRLSTTLSDCYPKYRFLMFAKPSASWSHLWQFKKGASDLIAGSLS